MNNELELVEPSKNMTIPAGVGQGLSGKYKVFVVDKDNNIVWEQKDWHKNLILNQGMDALYGVVYAGVMYYAACGNGTRVNAIISQGSSGSVTSGLFTLTPVGSGMSSLTGSSGGYTNAVSAYDMISFGNGADYMVTGVSNTSASVSGPSLAIPPTNYGLSSFTIYKTSQVGLQSETHRVGGLPDGNGTGWFAGAGYCGSTQVGNIVQNRRTWDFPYELSAINYTEVGVGWGATTGSVGSNYPGGNPTTIFSRILLPAPVPIGVAQKLRLIYELDIAMYPSGSPIPGTASISGWPVAPSTDTGYYSNLTSYLITTIDIFGNPSNAEFAALDPAVSVLMFLSPTTTALGNSGTSWTGTGLGYVGSSFSPYTSLNFTSNKICVFPVASSVANNIRSTGVGFVNYTSPWATGYNCFVMVFNQNQTKTNVQTLTLAFQYSWTRTLS